MLLSANIGLHQRFGMRAMYYYGNVPLSPKRQLRTTFYPLTKRRPQRSSFVGWGLLVCKEHPCRSNRPCF